MSKTSNLMLVSDTGTRAIKERSLYWKDEKDLDRVFYLDANIECNKNNECKMEANEPIGI